MLMSTLHMWSRRFESPAGSWKQGRTFKMLVSHYMYTLLQIDYVSQGIWILIFSYKFITFKSCLVCIFLCPKLWIKLRCHTVLHSLKMKRKWRIYLLKIRTKPYNFLYIVSHLLLIVYFLYRTGKTFGLPLHDPRDWKHPTEQIAVSEMIYWSLAHGITKRVLLLLESSCIIVFLLSFWRTVLGQGQGVMLKCHRRLTFYCQGLVFVRADKDQTCFSKAVPPQRYQLHSRSTTIHHTAVQELGPW